MALGGGEKSPWSPNHQGFDSKKGLGEGSLLAMAVATSCQGRYDLGELDLRGPCCCRVSSVSKFEAFEKIYGRIIAGSD